MESILFYDLEATGTDPYEDRVVEMYFEEWPIAGNRGEPLKWGTLVDPERPIPEDATEVHGIHDGHVEAAEPFCAFAQRVQTMVEHSSALCGYSIRTFDTLLLNAELERCGEPGVPLDEVVEVDLYQLWMEQEPRTLEGALQRFLGREIEDAHQAEADVKHLPDLLTAMRQDLLGHLAGGMLDMDRVQEIADACHPEGAVDRAGKLKRNEQGQVVYAFGPHEDEVVGTCDGFGEWMLRKDFAPETKNLVSKLLDGQEV